MLNRGLEYLNQSKIEQFSIRSFVYQLEISRTKFYSDYFYYMDYFKELIEYFLELNTPDNRYKDVNDLIEKDLILIAANEVLFSNLLFITRKQSEERNDYLKKLYCKRIIDFLIQNSRMDLNNDIEIKQKIVQCYADYFVQRLIEWINVGSLEDNFSQIYDLILLCKQLFYPNKNFLIIKTVNYWYSKVVKCTEARKEDLILYINSLQVRKSYVIYNNAVNLLLIIRQHL
ncbi:hypothetical protein [Xylocopilactobacillus apis]|uniref:hypothetical protein n=1 Tax=Xylocopilactobacillus apis TaxID=2932183 RepID=UPI002952BA6B|nr:hypothetical protein [Xylocopilactobacillus apis]